MGPPFEYESISFLASSNKLRAAERFSFSGLEISELHGRKHVKEVNIFYSGESANVLAEKNWNYKTRKDNDLTPIIQCS